MLVGIEIEVFVIVDVNGVLEAIVIVELEWDKLVIVLE